jgi:hypothetical protein
MAGLRVNDDMGASCLEGATCRKTERQGEKSDEKVAKFYHGNKNRCTLIAAGWLATGESECRAAMFSRQGGWRFVEAPLANLC